MEHASRTGILILRRLKPLLGARRELARYAQILAGERALTRCQLRLTRTQAEDTAISKWPLAHLDPD